jgi:hypothetical protein
VERGEGSNMVRTGALCAKLSNANRIHQMRPPLPQCQPKTKRNQPRLTRPTSVPRMCKERDVQRELR